MTTERNIIIHAGQTFELSLDYAGTAGRGQRMHIRASDAAADVIAILSHNGDANARVIYDGTDSIDITIGASVNGGWLVGANRVEWVYDIEDYDLSDTDDVVIAYRGKAVVYGNRTRPEDVTPSAALPSGDGRYVRFDGVQGLTDAQKLQARENIGAGTGGGGGSGDVVGPTSATDDRIAAFDGTTGKLIKQGTVTATAVASHLSNTSNPHSVTAAQVGADPAGTATSAVSTHNSVTTGAHGMTAFGASLVDDADASAARTTLGLGTAATANTGDFAAASHTHNASDINAGTLDAARLPAPGTTTLGGVKRNTGSAGQFLTGIDTDGSLIRDTPAGGGADIQEFTATGTWTNPSSTGKKYGRAYLVGAGGAACAGNANASTGVLGGSGGGGGRLVVVDFLLSSVGSTETVTIGAGATGSASVSSGFASNPSAHGGSTTFGARFEARGGRSAANSPTAGEGGGSYNLGAWPSFTISAASGSGGLASASTPAAGSTPTTLTATGGGAGGGITAGGAAMSGAAGGRFQGINTSYGEPIAATTAATAGSAGNAGSAGTTQHGVGHGGGGGGSSTTGSAGAGGAGSYPGGGGGGGGASVTGNASGAGGNGADGYALIVCW